MKIDKFDKATIQWYDKDGTYHVEDFDKLEPLIIFLQILNGDLSLEDLKP